MEDARRHFRIDVAGRFIGDEQFGTGNHRAGDGEALLLAARQGRRGGAGTIRKTDPSQHLPHRAFDIDPVGPGNAQRQRDIVERGQMTDQPEILVDHSDPAAEAGQRLARQVAQLLIEQSHPAAGRALRQIQQFEQRRLARARGAGEEIETAARQPEVDVAQHLGTRAVA